MLTFNQLKDLLEVVKSINDGLSKERALYEQLFEDFDGFSKTTVNTFDSLIDFMDKHTGDQGWISWWVFEADFGNNKLEASANVGDPLVTVDSLDVLYSLIVGGRDA